MQLSDLNKQLANTAAAASPKPMTPDCLPTASEDESYAITPEQPDEDDAASFFAAVVATGTESQPAAHVGEEDADALFAAAAAITSS